MMKRTDRYVAEFTVNYEVGDKHVRMSRKLTLAGLQDMIGTVIEETPEATSYLITVVRVIHTEEEKLAA